MNQRQIEKLRRKFFLLSSIAFILVILFVGGVMFGLGWKNDDADGKTRGINTIIAGAIVVAVAGLSSQFFA